MSFSEISTSTFSLLFFQRETLLDQRVVESEPNCYPRIPVVCSCITERMIRLAFLEESYYFTHCLFCFPN